MYHYVRPPEERWSDDHHVLELSEFCRQMDTVSRDSICVTAADIEGILRGEIERPHRSRRLTWLTFDDGYKDCVRYVLPELRERGLAGSVLVPTRAVFDRILLDVNAIHFILAMAPSAADVVAVIRDEWLRQELTTGSGEDFDLAFARLAVANRWNDGNSRFVKKVLQRELPASRRSAIIVRLLGEFGTKSPSELARDLYLTPLDLLALQDAGIEIGSHGHDHSWLADSSASDQYADLETSVRLLSESGIRDASRVMSYPFGSYSRETIDVARALGLRFGLTNDEGPLASLAYGIRDWLTIHRIDAIFFDRCFDET